MNQHSARGLTAITQDQRAESRTATVFRPVVITAAESVTLALVRNLSPQGMRAKVCTSSTTGGPITVQFGSDELIDGAIVWCEGDHIGVKFDQVIDVAQVLKNLSKKVLRGKLNRALRLQIHSVGQLLIGARSLNIEVQDISQRGLKVLTSYVRPGDEVCVCLEGLENRKAQVRWTQAGMAGLNFVRPLPFDELALWVGGRQMAAPIRVSQNFDDQYVISDPLAHALRRAG